MSAATSSDRETVEMPAQHITTPLERSFSAEEMDLIHNGLIPEQMEDKWFVYWKDDTLYFHRSWTGFCVYIVRFSIENDTYRMIEADVNRDQEQYSETSDQLDVAMISYLIDVLLLGRDAEFPSAETSPENRAAQQWSQVGRAMLDAPPPVTDPGLRVCIHRGAKQIGGTCIELESQGMRLVLDVGMPLDAVDPDAVETPNVQGFKDEDPSLLGVVISHPHQDHYGLASRVPAGTTFLMGSATERILAASMDFTPTGGKFESVIHLKDRKQIELGPFLITPYLMDHSAYDAYAILVEADGHRLFYTGDLRGHGRKAKLFERLLSNPPHDVNALLMEGTTITRTGTAGGFLTEADLETEMVDIFKATNGMPLVWCSGQNIDRLVTVFRAAKRSGRQLILDMYTAHILAATENPSLPQAHWKETRVYLPWSQKQRIIKDKSFEIADRYKLDRIYPEQLAGAANHSVMLFRPSMRLDLQKADCLTDACLVYSMWNGYLKDEKLKPFLTWLDTHNIPMHQCHTSGHASVKDLQRLRAAFKNAVVVPIHTQQPDLYEQTFGNVQMHNDGDQWEMATPTDPSEKENA